MLEQGLIPVPTPHPWMDVVEDQEGDSGANSIMNTGDMSAKGQTWITRPHGGEMVISSSPERHAHSQRRR